ncbi:MAG: hypothetical protein O2904_01875 [bacterium]|nr:hypothetical protein [bacterium]
MVKRDRELEVDVTLEGGKAVIQGKTTVPFQKFVQLILQRKVVSLFKDSGEEPIIVSSTLLTNLASAPQDNQENQSQLVLVTLAIGILAGIFIFAVGEMILASFSIELAQREYLIIAGTLLGLVVLVSAAIKVNRKKKSTKITDALESVASLLSK